MDSLWTHGLLVPKSSGVSYLLRDEFTTALAAGSVNGTLAQPGGVGTIAQKTRTVVDTENKLSITGGSLSVSPQDIGPAFGDPSMWYGAFSRVAGRMLFGTLNRLGGSASKELNFGWSATNTGAKILSGNAVYFDAAIYAFNNNTVALMSPITDGTAYPVALVLKSAGAYFFIKVSGIWAMLWMSSLNNTATLYPTISNFSTITTADSIRIPVATWLPTPLAYDTFTRADGVPGNSETTGPDSQTVTARTWAVQSGVWAISTSKLVATTAGIITLPSVGNGDYFISVKVTLPAVGITPGGIIVRWTNATNYWYLKITPGTAGADFELVEVNAGALTTRASADIDWVANTEYTIKIAVEGSDEWRVFVNDVSKITYTTANTFNQSASVIGLQDEGNSNLKFDEVLVFARGTNGEYSQLNGY